MTAAMALLDLEKTRMRHGQPVSHIAAGLPAGDGPTEAVIAADSPAVVSHATRPAGKPAAICQTASDGMTLDEMLADPEMLDVIRQTRRELERADPNAVLTDESVGRMIHARMRELRGRGAAPNPPRVHHTP